MSSINAGPSTIRPAAPKVNTSTAAPAKRKAEDADLNGRPKAARLDIKTTLAPAPSRTIVLSAAQRAVAPIAKPQVSKPQVLKPSPALNTGARPILATSTAPTKPSAAPKSGYLATLERAKAAQEAAKEFGQIKHKRVEKLSRRDRERLAAEEASRSKSKRPIKTPNGILPSRGKSAVVPDPKAAKKERKPIDVGYKGTMRPNASRQPSYRGTMNGPGRAPAGRPVPGAKEPRTGYASYSDEEEDEEEDDYESGSDMEAGVDDMQREEMESARIARMEDEQALREENEAKRQKAERKRKLDLVAAAARKKGPTY